MKKSLFLTTALVAAGFMTLGATDVAAAGKKGKMGITGTYKALAGYAKQQGAYENLQTGTSRTSYNTIDFKTDSEVHFKASHVTDGGLKVGVFVELETDQASTATIDGSGVTIGGGFGTVMIGNAAHAAAIMNVNAPGVGAVGLTGPDLASWVLAPAAVPMGAAGTSIGGRDDMKLRWVSSSFSGFTIGGSYTPSQTSGNNMAANGGNSGTEVAVADAAVKYSGKMGASTVSANYAMWSTDAGTASVDGWSAGASTTFGAFTVGASYKDVESTGKTAAGVSVSTTSTSSSEEAVGVGAVWKQGKMQLSLGYFNSSMPRATATAGDDEATKWVLGADYAMGPGVNFVGTVASVKWDDEANTNTANNNKGVAVIGGVKIAF